MSHNGVEKAPLVDVYFAALPTSGEVRRVFPPARDEDIRTTANARVRREKYFVWRLLDFALQQSFGLPLTAFSFTHHENGRWSSPSCAFSLSHSEKVLAVAVSNAPVGVDVERVLAPRAAGFAARVLSPLESEVFATLPREAQTEYLISRWVGKEALFKRCGEGDFLPRLLIPTKKNSKGGTLTVADELYAWSVATNTPDTVRVFADVDLLKFEGEDAI